MRKGISVLVSMMAFLMASPLSAAETKASPFLPKHYPEPPSARLLSAPLRYENITDNEVRQIQAAIPAGMPRDIVNISGVVDGCFCEGDSACTSQVAVMIKKDVFQKQLIFSQVDKKWGLSALDKWWLDYLKLSRVCNSAQVKSDTGWVKACRDRQLKMRETAPVCE